MTIVQRYIVRHFLGPLAFAVAVCAALFLVGDLFDLMRFLWKHPVPAGLVGNYLLLRLPLIIYQVLPVAVLLGAWFCFGQLARTHELTVLRAAGLSDRQLAVPVLAVTLLLCLLAAWFAIGPAGPLAVRARELKNHQLRGQPAPEPAGSHRDLHLVLGPFASLTAGKVARGGAQLEGLTLLERGADQQFRIRVECAAADWDPATGWTGRQVAVREFRADQTLAGYREFDTAPLPLPAALEPATLWRLAERAELNPEDRLELSNQLTLPELADLIVLLDRNGLTSLTERVTFHSRLAYPFLPFGFAVLGLVFLSVFRQLNPSFGFGIAVLTAFLFLIFTAVSKALGMKELVPPWVAGWLPHPALLLLALLLHRLGRVR